MRDCSLRTCPSTTTQQTLSLSTSTSGLSMAMIGTTTAVESNTLITMPDTGASAADDNNTALIGGIVGGVAALLLIVGLIAFIVVCNRKANASQQRDSRNNDGFSLQTSPQSAVVPSPSAPRYAERAMIQSPNENHYDSLAPSEVGNSSRSASSGPRYVAQVPILSAAQNQYDSLTPKEVGVVQWSHELH
jgi:hypothetical protein